jgi:hypothetical protein
LQIEEMINKCVFVKIRLEALYFTRDVSLQ